VQQHIHPGQRVLHPEPRPDLIRDPGQRPALIRIAARRRPGIQHRLQLSDLGRRQLAPGSARALGSQRRTAAARARRHRFADIRDTRKCFATSRSLAPASIISAAASRTRSRRARSCAVSPPPSGYLMPPAYRTSCPVTRLNNPRY
jgi:hypothetical protein